MLVRNWCLCLEGAVFPCRAGGTDGGGSAGDGCGLRPRNQSIARTSGYHIWHDCDLPNTAPGPLPASSLTL